MSVYWDGMKSIDEPKVISFAESLLVLGKLLSDPGCDIMLAQDISLRDMILLKPLELPCRGLGCKHIQCFDFKAYIHVNSGRISSAYMCPICNQVSNPSKIYVDSIFLCLMKILPDNANVSIVKDGTFEVTSVKPVQEVINIDDSDDDDDVLSSSLSNGFHGNKTVGSIKELQHVVKYTIAKSKSKQTTLQELSTASLDDVLHLMNVDTAWGVGSIPNITEALQTCIRDKRPYVCSTRNSLCHALQAVDGVGEKRATRIVEHFYSILQNKLSNFLKFVADRSLFKSVKQLNTLSSVLVVDFLKKNGALKLISPTTTSNDDSTTTTNTATLNKKSKPTDQIVENAKNPPSKRQRSDSVISVATCTSSTGVSSVPASIPNYPATTSPNTSSSSVSYPVNAAVSPMKPSISAGRAKSSSSICGEGIADVARPPRLHRSVSVFSVESENSLTTREAGSIASNGPSTGRPPVSIQTTASPASTSRRQRRERTVQMGLSSPSDTYTNRPFIALSSPSSSAADPIDVDAEAAAGDDVVSVSSSSVVVVRPGRQGRKRRLSLSSNTSAQSGSAVHTTTDRDETLTIVSAASSSSSVSQISHTFACTSSIAASGGLQLAPRLPIPQATPAITIDTSTKHNGGAATIIVHDSSDVVSETDQLLTETVIKPSLVEDKNERLSSQRTPSRFQKSVVKPVSSPGGVNARKNSNLPISPTSKNSNSSSSSSSSSNVHIRFDDVLEASATTTTTNCKSELITNDPPTPKPSTRDGISAASSGRVEQPGTRSVSAISTPNTTSSDVAVSITDRERIAYQKPTHMSTTSARPVTQIQSQQRTVNSPTPPLRTTVTSSQLPVPPMTVNSKVGLNSPQQRAPSAADRTAASQPATEKVEMGPVTTTVSRGLATARAARFPLSHRTLASTPSITMPENTTLRSNRVSTPIAGTKRNRFDESNPVSVVDIVKPSYTLKPHTVDVRSRDYSQKDMAVLKEKQNPLVGSDVQSLQQFRKEEGQFSSSSSTSAVAATDASQSLSWKPPLPPGPIPATTIIETKSAAPMRFVPRLSASAQQQGHSITTSADLRNPPSRNSGQFRDDYASIRAGRAAQEDRRDFGQYRDRDMGYSDSSRQNRFPPEDRYPNKYVERDAGRRAAAGRLVWEDSRGSAQYPDRGVTYSDRREDRWDGRRYSCNPPDYRHTFSSSREYYHNDRYDRYEQRGSREDCNQRGRFGDEERPILNSLAVTFSHSSREQSLRDSIKEERSFNQTHRYTVDNDNRRDRNSSYARPSTQSSTEIRNNQQSNQKRRQGSPERNDPAIPALNKNQASNCQISSSSGPQRQSLRFPENTPIINDVCSHPTTDQHKAVSTKCISEVAQAPRSADSSQRVSENLRPASSTLMNPAPRSANTSQRVPENPPPASSTLKSPIPQCANTSQRVPENPRSAASTMMSPAPQSANTSQRVPENPPPDCSNTLMSPVLQIARPAERQQQHIRFAQDLSPYLAQFDSLSAATVGPPASEQEKRQKSNPKIEGGVDAVLPVKSKSSGKSDGNKVSSNDKGKPKKQQLKQQQAGTKPSKEGKPLKQGNQQQQTNKHSGSKQKGKQHTPSAATAKELTTSISSTESKDDATAKTPTIPATSSFTQLVVGHFVSGE